MENAQYSTIGHDHGTASRDRPPTKRYHTRLSIWLALTMMVGLILCLIAAVFVVRVAEGKPVDSWSIEPTVILAQLSIITSTLLGFVLTTSITIRWWREVQRGATLSQLHYVWAVNPSLLLQPHRWKGNIFVNSSTVKFVIGTIIIMISSFAVPLLFQQATRPQVRVEVVGRRQYHTGCPKPISKGADWLCS